MRSILSIVVFQSVELGGRSAPEHVRQSQPDQHSFVRDGVPQPARSVTADGWVGRRGGANLEELRECSPQSSSVSLLVAGCL